MTRIKTYPLRLQRDYWHILLEIYPNLLYRHEYVGILRLLALGETCQATGGVIASHAYLQRLSRSTSKHFRSGVLLNSFKRDVLPELEITDYDRGVGLARTLRGVELPAEVRSVFVPRREVLQLEDWRKVNTLGKALQRNEVPNYHAEREQQYQRSLATMGAEITARTRLLEHFNLHVNTAMIGRIYARNMEAAITALEQYEASAPNKRAAERFWGWLDEVLYLRKTYYDISPGTDRLTPEGFHVLGLPASVRNALYKGCISVDLVASQLVLNLQAWQAYSQFIPSDVTKDMQNILTEIKSGRKLWNDFEPEEKPLVKVALYSIIYGASRERIETDLSNASLVSKVFAHPWIATMWKARRHLQKAMYSGDLVVKHPFTGEIMSERGHEPVTRPDGSITIKPTTNFGSAMARLAQSYETAVMAGILDAHKQLGDAATPVLYVYDGAVFSVRRQREIPKIKETIEKCIIAAGEKLGLFVAVETEVL